MLKENIRILRKQRGLSQEELSVQLNVVRQTISKWEQGLSVPDAEMLIAISKVFDTPVSVLLGENIEEKEENELQVISKKLEIINRQLYEEKKLKRKKLFYICLSFSIMIVVITLLLYILNSPYLNWNYNIPENAVLGVIYHYFEWLFMRVAPFVFILLIVVMIVLKKKK